MVLPSKTIELIEQIAERLERWAKSWGKRLLKNRPHNLRQFRQSLLVEFESADLPQVAFKTEFHSGLNEALEGFDLALERLYLHIPSIATLVEKKHKNLIAEAKLIGKLSEGDPIWFKRFNNSRNSAISLAKTLHHILKMTKENVLSERQKDGMIQLELPTRHVPLTKAAEWFGCDYRTLKKDIKSGKITARRISDRRWEFDLDQVTGFNPSVRTDADPAERSNTP
jgi:hypothetical protein